MKPHWLSLAAVILAVCGLPGTSLAHGAGTFRVGGALGMATYSPDNVNDIIDDYHGEFSDWIDFLEHDPDIYDLESSFDDDELGAGLVIDVRIEYLVSDNMGLGIGFLPLSTGGGCDYDISYWDDWEYTLVEMREDTDFNGTGKLVSVYGFYRMPVGNALSLRIGGGLDYVFGGKLEFDSRGRYEDDYMQGEGGASFEATGTGFGFHALVGGEYQITDRLLLVGDVAYRVAKVGELEVEDASVWDDGDHDDWEGMNEGEVLQWVHDEEYDYYYFSTEDDGDEVGLDFGGLYLTVGAFFCF